MSTASIGDVELYYDEQGSGDPLLLIMGLAADSTAWLFQVPELAAPARGARPLSAVTRPPVVPAG